MTPLLLSRSWHVTSVVRNPDHVEEIKSHAKGQPGKLEVLVRSLEDVKNESQAKGVLDEARPHYVIWSAGMRRFSLHRKLILTNDIGAGGKGGSERTYAIDRDAAQHFINASVRTSSITKFLMVSYIGSRRNQPPWFSNDEWRSTQERNNGALSHYAVAKIDADECLTALAKQRGGGFQDIVLRPGGLTDEAPTGKVALGHTKARGTVSRADVADVAVRLLERPDTRGYYDLLNGEEDVGEAVNRVVREEVDCIEGEDVDSMVEKYKL